MLASQPYGLLLLLCRGVAPCGLIAEVRLEARVDVAVLDGGYLDVTQRLTLTLQGETGTGD